MGALSISSGGYLYRDSAIARSPNWVLSAGHNVEHHQLRDLHLKLNLPKKVEKEIADESEPDLRA